MFIQSSNFCICFFVYFEMSVSLGVKRLMILFAFSLVPPFEGVEGLQKMDCTSGIPCAERIFYGIGIDEFTVVVTCGRFQDGEDVAE